MNVKAKISIEIPNYHKPGKYFNLRLQPRLNKEPVEFKRPRNLFIVAQRQNDFIGFCRLLIRKRIISNHFEWTFGTGHLIILGELSSENQTVEPLWLLYSLEEQAKLNGGYIHFLPAWPEKIETMPAWIHEHPHYAIREASGRYPLAALYDGNQELWRWILTKNIVEKIGDFIVTHQHLLPLLNCTTNTLKKINQDAQSKQLNPYCGGVPLGSNDLLGTKEIDNILKKFHTKQLVITCSENPTALTHSNSKILCVNRNDPMQLNALLIGSKHVYGFSPAGKKHPILQL